MHPKITMLVAEDDESDALLLLRAARLEGINPAPHIVHNGHDVLAYLQHRGVYSDPSLHPTPDVLLLDLKMPGCSGFDVLRWVRENPEKRITPTIIMSSSADPRDVKLAYCLGANAYIQKPLQFDELRTKLRTLVAFWNECITPVLDDEPALPSCEGLIQARHPI